MELPGRCGDWLDTATVTVQGPDFMDDTSRGWGLLPGHQRGPHLATSGDFATAMDNLRHPLQESDLGRQATIAKPSPAWSGA